LGLEEIHTIMALRRAGILPSGDIIALLQARFGKIQRQLSELQSLRHALADVLDAAIAKEHQGEDAQLCHILDQTPVGP
jgi:hypothetical protein